MVRYLHMDYEKKKKKVGKQCFKQICRKCLEKVEEDFFLTALYS